MHYAIIATDHDLQKAVSTHRGLEERLATIIGRGGVVLIAEEVDANKHVDTFGRDLSRKLIGENRWLSIDMTNDQRKNAGIHEELVDRNVPDFREVPPLLVCRYFRRADGIRENFWLDRIEEKCAELKMTEGTVVITCGHIHGQPFVREGEGPWLRRDPGRIFAARF